MSNAAAVAAHEVKVARGGNEILHGLTFAVPRGSIVGLVGPSGGGKTTLMRSIVGVQRLAAGSVDVLGESAGTASLRSRIGYVTQSPAVYDDLTVLENLRYFARIVGVDNDNADRALHDVDLQDYAGRLVMTLSGGQRARVSLATALLGTPELLVLDEPTVGLDPVLRRDLWELFARLAAGGTTLLVSSHVMDEAARCDRMLILRDGSLLADESPASLLERTGSESIEDAFLSLIEGTAR